MNCNRWFYQETLSEKSICLGTQSTSLWIGRHSDVAFALYKSEWMSVIEINRLLRTNYDRQRSFLMFLSKNRQKLHYFHDLTEKKRPLKLNLDVFLWPYLMRANLSKNEKWVYCTNWLNGCPGCQWQSWFTWYRPVSENPRFCVADYVTLSGVRRLHSKIVLLFNTDKRTLRSKIWRAPTFEKSLGFCKLRPWII